MKLADRIFLPDQWGRNCLSVIERCIHTVCLNLALLTRFALKKYLCRVLQTSFLRVSVPTLIFQDPTATPKLISFIQLFASGSSNFRLSHLTLQLIKEILCYLRSTNALACCTIKIIAQIISIPSANTKRYTYVSSDTSLCIYDDTYKDDGGDVDDDDEDGDDDDE